MKNTQTEWPPYAPGTLTVFKLPNGEDRYHRIPSGNLNQLKAKSRYDDAIQALNSPISQAALTKLCTAGCQRDWLTTILLQGAALDLKPSTRLYKKDEFRDIEIVLKEMRFIAGSLGDSRWYELMTIFAGVSVAGPHGLRTQLETAADSINAALSSGWKLAQVFSGLDNAVILENYVRTTAGTPHYTELATLLGAVHRNSTFSPEKLKAHMRAYRRSPKRTG